MLLIGHMGADASKMLRQSLLTDLFVALDDQDVVRWFVADCQEIYALKILNQGIREGESEYFCLFAICHQALGLDVRVLQHLVMQSCQLLNMSDSIDNRIPKNHPVNVLSPRPGHNRQGASQPEPNQTDLRNSTPSPHVTNGRVKIGEPLTSRSLIKASGGIAASVEIEPQHPKTNVGQTEGQFPTCTVEPDVLLSHWVAQHDSAISTHAGQWGIIAAKERLC